MANPVLRPVLQRMMRGSWLKMLLLAAAALVVTSTTRGVEASSSSSLLSAESPVTGSKVQWRIPAAAIATPAGSDLHHMHALHRILEIGDFKSLNDMLQGATIAIPGEFSVDAVDTSSSPAGNLPFIGDIINTVTTVKVQVKNIQCKNLNVGDILLTATSEENAAEENLPVVTQLSMEIQDFDFECDLDYTVDTVMPDSSGQINLKSPNNNLMAEFTMTSNKVTQSEPDISVQMQEGWCSAEMNVEGITFSTGNLLEHIMNALDGLIKDEVKKSLQSTVCDELKSVGDKTLPEAFAKASEALQPYLVDLGAEWTNPLYQEEALESSLQQAIQEQTAGTPSSPYMNFQNASASDHELSALVQLAMDGIEMADEWLGGETTNPEDGTSDLMINTLIRDFFLDESGTFVWDMTNMSSSASLGDLLGKQSNPKPSPAEGMVLLESHDDLFQMKMTLDRMEIRGLDSMTKFETFEPIGKHTLQSSMAWKFLSGTAKMTFEILPSSLPESMWSSVQPGLEIVEQVELQLSIDQIEAVLSLFLAVNQNQLGQVPLGSLFKSDAVASCMLSTIFPGDLVAGFDITLEDLIDPTVEGFSSPGLDRVMTEVADLMYDMYEHWIIKAMPNIAQKTLRNMTNTAWSDFLSGLQSDQAQACSLADLPVQEGGEVAYMDFRDLLLPVDEARAKGASGNQPYGDFAPLIFGLLQEQLLVVDEQDSHNRLRLNSMLLDPLTSTQSGEPGTLHFPSDLVSFAVENGEKAPSDGSNLLSDIVSSMFGSLELRLYDAKIQNINSIVAPSYLLQTSDNPYLLENELRFGPIADKPLNASIRLSVATGSSSEGSTQQNASDSVAATTPAARSLSSNAEEYQMDISLSADSLRIAADIIAMLDATSLQRFPLQDIANPYCWLATIPAPILDSEGKVSSTQEGPQGLKLDAFVADIMNLAVGAQCANEACLKGGLGAFAELTEIWKENNVTSTLGERFGDLSSDLLTGDYVHNLVSRWLNEAPQMCPHIESNNASLIEYPSLGLPVFSPQSVDTMVFSALTAAQAALLVISQSPSMFSTSTNQNEALPVSDSDKRLIDFTDAGGGVESLAGLISFIFSQANTMLGEQGSKIGSDKKDFGINQIIGGMLNEEGALELTFDDASIGMSSNLQLRLTSLRVIGLDTFSEFNILNAVGPQLLENSIKIEKLAAEIKLEIVSGGIASSFGLSFGAEDISAAFHIFAAINADTLDALELGSLLEIDRILPCIFTAVEQIVVPSVNLSVKQLTDVKVEGLLPATNDAFSLSMAAITERFGVGIDGFLNPVLGAVINGLMSSFKKDAKCENVMRSAQSRRRMQSAEVSPQSYIDFRDLLLPESLSLEYGGTGQSPYGDLFRTVLAFVQGLILEVNPVTKLSAVNEQLIAPLTRASSNVTGSIIMAGAFIDTESRIQIEDFDANLTLRVSDARIDNLDTLGAPMSLLSPVAQKPHLLNNTATIGVPEERPLRLSVRLLVGLQQDGKFEKKELDSYNDVS